MSEGKKQSDVSRRKFLKIGAGAAVAAAVVGGAGYYLSQPSPPPTPTATATATSVPPTTTPVKETLKLWWTDNRKAGLDMLDYFATGCERDLGIKIVREEIPWGTFNDKVQAAFIAGELPDILFVWGIYGTAYLYQGILRPVNDIIDGIGRANWPPYQLLANNLEGQDACIPWTGTPHVLYYRKDWYEEAGLNPPKTWNEWYETGKALTKERAGKKVYGVGTYYKYPEMYYLYNLMGNTGAYAFDKDYKNVTIDSPEFVAALEYLQKLDRDTATPGGAAVNMSEVRLAMIGGACASMYSSSSFAYELTTEPTAKKVLPYLSTVPCPVRDDWKGPVYGPYFGQMAWGITATTKKDEACRKALNWFFDYDHLVELNSMTITGWVPVDLRSPKDKRYLESPQVAPVLDQVQAGLKSLETASVPLQEWGPNKYAGPIQGEGTLVTAQSKLVVDKMAPKDVAKWCQKEIERIVKETA